MGNLFARSRGWGAGAVLAAGLAMGLATPAAAWEVINNGLPTFAAAESFRVDTAASLRGASPALKLESLQGSSFGYNYSFGGKYLFGVEQKTGFAAGGGLPGLSQSFGAASGLGFSRTDMKFGYDMGAFKPYVSASFAEAGGPAFGAGVFAAPPGAAVPYAFTPQATSVGAGFDYAITDKLSFGMSLTATQVSGWRR
ncbi:MAG: hypothetical protein ACK5JM_12340 [Rhodoblastus sp.]